MKQKNDLKVKSFMKKHEKRLEDIENLLESLNRGTLIISQCITRARKQTQKFLEETK